MVCIIHRLEPRISPQNHPRSPNSQDPNVLMFLWSRTHQNMEAFVLKTIDYLRLFHFIRAPGGKNHFIQIVQSYLVCIIFLILPPMMGQGVALFYP